MCAYTHEYTKTHPKNTKNIPRYTTENTLNVSTYTENCSGPRTCTRITKTAQANNLRSRHLTNTGIEQN